ncbi:DUF4184 family protein [Pontibacter sp. H259]|uniref:DUF4184 family protein n=1 Tax=Pontibacter sp. H259 TaxID=3133421 RepID=UPI0030C5D5A4
MPFTFSHPAIVLPFRLLPKSWISLTGLIVGSVVPDFEKFINMEPGNTISHTKVGVLLFNLPMGVLLSFLFHTMIRDPFVEHLPRFLERRLISIERINWVKYFKKHNIKICISIIIGAVLHIGWDSMTHKSGLIVRLFPQLNRVVEFGNYEGAVFSLLDFASTIIGGLYVLCTILLLPTKDVLSVKDVRRKLNFWFIVVVISICVLIIRALAGLGQNWHWDIIISSITAFLIGIIVASLVVKYKPS